MTLILHPIETKSLKQDMYSIFMGLLLQLCRTTKAEYIALTEAVKEGKWLKGILKDFGIDQGCVLINCDSKSATPSVSS